jgi:hypothetical protein
MTGGYLLLRGKGSDSQGPGLSLVMGVDIFLACAHSPFIAAREATHMDTAMTQAEIETAKQAAVVAHGPVVDSYGFFDSIVYRYADGARATLTYDERKEVRGWVYKIRA